MSVWLSKQDIINSESICIFADSSYRENYMDVKGITCPAICVTCNGTIIDQKYSLEYNSTSQRGELYALAMAVHESIKYRNYKYIRIFSDSLNGILALRERVFKWIERANAGLEYYDPAPNTLGAKNEDLIMSTIYNITMNNIPLELFHVKGHVNYSQYGSLMHAKRVFSHSNGITVPIDTELIRILSIFNDMVDRYSTFNLNKHIEDQFYKSKLTDAISIGYNNNFNYSAYHNLLILPEDRYNKYGRRE